MKKTGSRFSVAPLKFKEAVSDMVRVMPERKSTKAGKRKKKGKGRKQT